MLRFAALVALSFAALALCKEDAPPEDAPPGDAPAADMQGDFGGYWNQNEQGMCRMVSCAQGFVCTSTSRMNNYPGIGNIGMKPQAMCVRFDASCADLVDSDDDWWGGNGYGNGNNIYGGNGPNNQFPGMGPGNGNQCNNDQDCYRLVMGGNNFNNGPTRMGVSCCRVRGQNMGMGGNQYRRRCIFHPRYLPSSLNNGPGK